MSKISLLSTDKTEKVTESKLFEKKLVISESESYLLKEDSIISLSRESTLSNEAENETAKMKEFNISAQLTQLGKDSKVHGVSNLVNSESKLLKIIWLLSLLTSGTYCIYQCISTIIDYSKFETTPSTEYEFESPALYPAVVICNLSNKKKFIRILK